MTLLEIVRWSVAVPLGLFGLLVILGNYGCLMDAILRQGSTSFIPMVGGVSLAIAMLICPLDSVQRFGWIPIVADISVVLGLISLAILAYGWIAKRPE